MSSIFIKRKTENKKDTPALSQFPSTLSLRQDTVVCGLILNLLTALSNSVHGENKEKSEVDGWWKVSEHLPQKRAKECQK